MTSTSTSPSWLEIIVHIHPIAHEALTAFLFDLGCEGVVSEDFQDLAIRAYLPPHHDAKRIENRIRSFLSTLEPIFPEVRTSTLTLTPLEDQDWDLQWRRHFHPQRITRNLMIFPAWEPIPEGLRTEAIRIDPGPAFGTGQHPTTRMCLQAMERISFPPPWTMLDVGTGSGILAIYGARLGAGRVVAVDTDPEALRWAGWNIALNELDDAVLLSSAPIEDLREVFSLLAANLILNTIMENLPHFSSLLAPGGWLILSGILRGQVREVESALPEYGLCKREILLEKEWACIMAKRCGGGAGFEAVLY
ncbi:MAG: 50S ribosomal protein L11 methyltransferase [Deltaproteobacteria bacterium]|nr:50S ribosomal protein L11 methyltransferase [Deltaproteobacteria bacterium]